MILEMVKEKELADKRLLSLEVVIGVLSSIFLFTMVFVAAFLEMEDWLRIVLIIGGTIPFAIGIGYAIRIEQIAGYYECGECHHKYIPTYSNVLWAMHINRTRYMKCPQCGKKSWNKKVIGK